MKKRKVVEFPTSYPGDDYQPLAEGEVALEVVTWLDHCTHYEQQVDEAGLQRIYEQGLARRETVGWVIHQDEECLYLAGTRDEHNHWSEITVLGTALVLERKVLK